jgi:hypothetical protein
MIQLLLLIFGLIALIKGEFKITGGRRVKGSIGRALGVLMLIGAALPLLIGTAGISVGIFVLVIIIGLVTSEKIEQQPTS